MSTLPEQRAIAQISLKILMLVRRRTEPVHEVVVFAVAIKISDPAKLHVVTEAIVDRYLQREIEIARLTGELAASRWMHWAPVRRRW